MLLYSQVLVWLKSLLQDYLLIYKRTLTFDSGPAIVHLMLADVRDFAKAERELVERDTVLTSISSGRGSPVV